MINLYLKNNQICVSLSKLNYSTFNECLSILKSSGFKYDKKSSEWFGPIHKKDFIKNRLEELDIVKDSISNRQLQLINEGTPEQKLETTRRIPDYSLLNYGPIIGKHPNEDFQKRLISMCINNNRYACFLGMGSGKSYITSAIIAHRKYKYNDCDKILLVTTNIGVRNLYYELIKFIKDIDVNRIKIADKNYRNPFDDKDTDIVITSYNSVRLISEYYKKQYHINSKMPRQSFWPIKQWTGPEGKAMIILDESHNIANPQSQQTQYLALHSKLFEYRYLFSGTPADNPLKLWQQYTFLDPYLVYNLNFNGWKDKMAYLGDRFSPYAVREWKKDQLEEQNQRFLKSYGVYYKTTELVDLPDYYEKTIYINMNKNHRDIYESVIVQDLAEQRSLRDLINRFPYQMLSLDDPELLKKHSDKFDDKLNKLIDKFNCNDLEKYNALSDIISDNPDSKIIVWVIHPSTAKRICDKFSKLNPICIIGETEQDERFKLVEEFKTGDYKLLVANIATLNTSVTILEAKVSVYFERGFNYTQFSQSQNRNYRIGQTDNVTQYTLVYNNSLDVLLSKNLESKGTLVSGLCAKEFLTNEEWKKIYNYNENDYRR